MIKATWLSGSFAAVLLSVAPAAVAPSAIAQPPPSASEPTQPEPIEVTEEQLDRFASAYQVVQSIQQETQADMVAAVEAEGLTVDEFNTLAQTLESSEEAEIPPQQAEPFLAAVEQVVAIQESVQADIEAAIQAENLTVEEFDQILYMALQDPILLEQINQRLE